MIKLTSAEVGKVDSPLYFEVDIELSEFNSNSEVKEFIFSTIKAWDELKPLPLGHKRTPSLTRNGRSVSLFEDFLENIPTNDGLDEASDLEERFEELDSVYQTIVMYYVDERNVSFEDALNRAENDEYSYIGADIDEAIEKYHMWNDEVPYDIPHGYIDYHDWRSTYFTYYSYQECELWFEDDY